MLVKDLNKIKQYLKIYTQIRQSLVEKLPRAQLYNGNCQNQKQKY